MTPIAGDEVADWVRRRAIDRDRYLFGITGPPGAGKSTLARTVAAELGATIVAMDGFHLSNDVLDALGLRAVKGAPETFAADEFVRLVRVLREPGSSARCPVFDRALDEPVPDGVEITSADSVVVVEGNYLLLDEPPWTVLSELLDVVAYVEVPPELRRRRLIDRHVTFGRSRHEASEFVRRSDEANARRIGSTRSRADVLVSPSLRPGP